MIGITNADIDLHPYPHGTSEQMLEPALFDDLRADFPSAELFSSNQKQPFADGRASRINMMQHDEAFVRFMDNSKVWRGFYNQVNSREFVEAIINLFGDNIQKTGGVVREDDWKFDGSGPHEVTSFRERLFRKFGVTAVLDRMRSALVQDALCVSFDIAWAREGYATEIHTDNRNKLAAFLVYFNETDGEGGEFLIHQLKEGVEAAADIRYPLEDEVDVIKMLSPKPNRGGIFLNCNRAYHSVPRLTGCTKPRQFLYVSIGARRSTPIWHEV
jgi:hypothetical protein